MVIEMSLKLISLDFQRKHGLEKGHLGVSNLQG